MDDLQPKGNYPQAFDQTPRAQGQRLLTVCWLLIRLLGPLLLTACTIPLATNQAQALPGGPSPEAVTNAFFTDLNQALQDPLLPQPETRRVWAERLASSFTPSEWVDQRAVFSQMLTSFANSLAELPADQQLSLNLRYTEVEVVQRDAERATVKLNEGSLQVRLVQRLPNGRLQILRDQQRPLTTTIGLEKGTWPVIRVGNRWFLTDQ